jgi:hypothetical protein
MCDAMLSAQQSHPTASPAHRFQPLRITHRALAAPLAGEPWDWTEAACKAAGGALIVGGNYAYFELRAASRAEAGQASLEVDVFEV